MRRNTPAIAVCFALFLFGTSLQALICSTTLKPNIAATFHAPKSESIRLHKVSYSGYKPAAVEDYIFNHLPELSLDIATPGKTKTCHIWNDPSSTPYYSQLHEYIGRLDAYYQMIESFQLKGITDLRENLTTEDNEVCGELELHPMGLPGLFGGDGQLSYTRSGWVEPLFPSMRHPRLCTEGRGYLLNTKYIIHDFQTICQRLKPSTRTVFVDLGASLSFHPRQQSPVFHILDLYRKFGIKFDHIYGYELEQQKPEEVWNAVPIRYQAAYHWINVGVSPDPEDRYNPFRMLVDEFSEDDFVVVKLDIDAPELEKQLIHLLLSNTKLSKMIDHLYFEHHVNQEELSMNWGDTLDTVQDSLNLFQLLRQDGVATHHWI